MANGHVEIHNPFSSLDGTTDLKPTSDSDSMEDTVELRLLMAYDKRRRPRRESPQKESPSQDVLVLSSGLDANESSSPQTLDKTEEKKKKKKRSMKRWRRSIFSCIKPQREDKEQRKSNEKLPNNDDRSSPVCEKDELTEAANKLTKIADEIQFLPPEIEPDSPEDENVEKMIGLLLRDAGDRLNEKELKDAAIATELFRDYGFFKLLMSTLLLRMGLKSLHPDSPGPKASPETQIAVACEVTSRLSEVMSLPRNRLLDHGARYLQHYYSPWVQQQGGYAKAFYSDDEDDE
ncbi:uncharacterized protein LOC116389887 isoform X2 [Anarrhichthys ocellatus]|uniref:uncharacterized protein LOC116389887 isoform X2 n=1 Tax=Anarrhichthys ocellatus TaxID=433405 RepID=UPI0012ECF091|nr:apoptosis facilitator Bcl-2-like protein 14 isoform X2 [Anarrhichthys ocellatus]